MRTIDKLIKYKFNYNQLCILEMKGYMNGCGSKQGFNFSNFIDRVKKFFNFKSKKLDSFSRDLKRLCSENHDIEFSLGGGIYDYFKANYDFISGILILLNRTSISIRLFVFIIIFIPLTIMGISSFKWGKKKTLSYLLE